MQRTRLVLFSLSFLLCLPSAVLGQQLWSGALNPTNATNWTQAGVQGGIPSGSWSQCTNSQCQAVTSAGTNASAAQINAALQNAPANTYVQLAAGTYNLNAGVNWGTASNVVLRGAGAGQTTLTFSGGLNCGGYNSVVCMNGYQLSNVYYGSNSPVSWTGGYSQGSTVVTLSSVSGLSAGMLIVLDQCDTGLSGGSGCTSGSPVDNGNYFNCGAQYSSSGPVGCAMNGPDGGNGRQWRFQSEVHTVASVNSSTNQVTLVEPIIHPNYASGQTPQAWWFPALSYDGVENLTVNGSQETGYTANIFMINVTNSWVKGVAVVKPYGPGFYAIDVNHINVQDSYFWENQYADDQAMQTTQAGFDLIQNNICQQHQDCFIEEGSDSGTVIAYNFLVNTCNYLSPNAVCKSDAQNSGYRPHSNGTDFNLLEGNVGPSYYADGVHGTHLSWTVYRNFFTGWEPCGTSNGSLYPNGPCGTAGQRDFDTNALLLTAFQGRYHSIIANVLGTPGYHADYQYTSGNDRYAIYNLGAGYGGGTPVDPIVATTTMRWGNWDAANGSTQWNTSEVPTGLSVYPSSVPTNCVSGGQCPASFYLGGQPSWWPSSIPWPAIGPDVTGGNVGQVSGTLNAANSYSGTFGIVGQTYAGNATNSAWGGHVNATPAMACYFNVMGGTPDGTSSSPLNFNASSCYGSSTATKTGPTPPTNLTGTVVQ